MENKLSALHRFDSLSSRVARGSDRYATKKNTGYDFSEGIAQTDGEECKHCRKGISQGSRMLISSGDTFCSENCLNKYFGA